MLSHLQLLLHFELECVTRLLLLDTLALRLFVLEHDLKEESENLASVLDVWEEE